MWPLRKPTFSQSLPLLLPDWYAIVKRIRIVVTDVDNNAENQWTLVPRRLDRSSPMLGTVVRALTTREALRAILSKAFLAKVTLCAIATTSLIISFLNIGFVQWTNRSYHTFDDKVYMRRIEYSYERNTNDNARKEWEEEPGSVPSTAFVMSYYMAIFEGLICK